MQIYDFESTSFNMNVNIHSLQNEQPTSGLKKVFTCHHCQKSFPFESLLRSHILRHTSERPFVCKICNASFKHKSNLNRHYWIHNQE